MSSAPHIKTGAMRHCMELQCKKQNQDGAGGLETQWVTEAEIWCQLRPLNGLQRLEGMQRESQVTHEIYTRYNAAVTPEKRLCFRGRAFNILAAWSPMELQEFTQVLAVEGVAT